MFVRNCKIYAEELPVNEAAGITNTGKFSRSYDDLCFGVTFLETRGIGLEDFIGSRRMRMFCLFG